MKRDFNAEYAEDSRWSRGTMAREARRRLCALRASFAPSALSLALALTLAGCGTKTELLLPNGKPNPAGQKDPSQPPSPISR